MAPLEKIKLNEKQLRARKNRSLVLAVLLAIFVIILYAVTFFKINQNTIH